MKWLSLENVLRAVPRMEEQNVSLVARGVKPSKQTKEGFIEAYIATDGDISKMNRRLTGRNDTETWGERRKQFIARHLEQMRAVDTHSDGWKNGEPTRRHLGLIAWAYTPSPKRFAKWIKTQPKASKKYISNPSQLKLSFVEKDQYLSEFDSDLVQEVVSAVVDRESKEPTVVIGTEKRPKNEGLYKALVQKYLKVDKKIPHKLSGLTMWFVRPTRKGFDLVAKRRKIIESQREQLSLFANPKKILTVPIHLLSSSGVHERIGTITLSDSAIGMQIDTDLENLPIGDHGTHIHEFGDLAPKYNVEKEKWIAGGSAGQHFDPYNAGYHGSPIGNGHLGDLPKITADEYGESHQTLFAPRLKVGDVIGKSIIVHRYGDNYSDYPLPNGGGKERYAGGIIKTSCQYCKNPTRDSKGRIISERYLKGYSGLQRKKRIKEIEQRNNEIDRAIKKYGSEDKFPQTVKRMLYRPFVTDKGKVTGESPYTKAARERGFNTDIPKDQIIPTAKKMGIVTTKEINDTKTNKSGKKDKRGAIPKYVFPVLKKTINASIYYDGVIPFESTVEAYRRGAAAWKTGHAKGQTPESWGLARVNSFLVGGKAFFSSDSDLANLLPPKIKTKIAKQSVEKKR